MVVEVVRSSEFWIFFKVGPIEYPDLRHQRKRGVTISASDFGAQD